MNRFVAFLILTCISTVTCIASITALTSQLIRTVHPVIVSWHGVSNPQSDDFIGVYCPPFNGTDHLNFLYGVFANTSRMTHYASGEGSIRVRVANMRLGYNFVYWSGGKAVAVSNDIAVDVAYPNQGHLGVVGEEGESKVVVMWVTGTAEGGMVRYGNDTFESVVEGVPYTYTVDDLKPCSNGVVTPAMELFRDPGWLHYALLDNLSPSSVYYYQFGSQSVMSDIYRFQSPPVTAATTKTTIAVYADQGTTLCLDPIGGWCALGANCVIDRLTKTVEQDPTSIDMVVVVGDLSYAVGRAYRWDMWMNEIQPVAARTPFSVVVGNHESDYIGQVFTPTWSNYGNDSDGECGIPTRNRFLMPWDDDAWWYGYELGNIHIVVISTEHNFTVGSQQWVWLNDHLRAIDRSRTPWIVVCGHRPFYSSGDSDDDQLMSVHFRSEMEQLLFTYQVDVVFGGHYHNYERTCSVYQEKCVPPDVRAPVHVIVGSAGIELEQGWIEPQPSWSLYRSNTAYGHIQLTTTENELNMQWIGCKDGKVLDQFSIRK